MLIFVVQCEYKSILHFRALEKKNVHFSNRLIKYFNIKSAVKSELLTAQFLEKQVITASPTLATQGNSINHSCFVPA